MTTPSLRMTVLTYLRDAIASDLQYNLSRLREFEASADLCRMKLDVLDELIAETEVGVRDILHPITDPHL